MYFQNKCHTKPNSQSITAMSLVHYFSLSSQWCRNSSTNISSKDACSFWNSNLTFTDNTWSTIPINTLSLYYRTSKPHNRSLPLSLHNQIRLSLSSLLSHQTPNPPNSKSSRNASIHSWKYSLSLSSNYPPLFWSCCSYPTYTVCYKFSWNRKTLSDHYGN